MWPAILSKSPETVPGRWWDKQVEGLRLPGAHGEVKDPIPCHSHCFMAFVMWVSSLNLSLCFRVLF